MSADPVGEVEAELREFATNSYASTHPERSKLLGWADRLAALSGGREQPEGDGWQRRRQRHPNDQAVKNEASREQPAGLREGLTGLEASAIISFIKNRAFWIPELDSGLRKLRDMAVDEALASPDQESERA